MAQNSFQHIPRLRFWWVIITTLDQFMLQSWYRKNCPISGKHVSIIFLTQWIAIATLWPTKNTLNFSFITSYFKLGTVNFFLLQYFNKMDKMKLSAKLKNILFKATLNFRTLKVALTTQYRILSNFPKVASYPAHQNSIKNFTVPFLKYMPSESK